jgi:hypothetical protein
MRLLLVLPLLASCATFGVRSSDRLALAGTTRACGDKLVPLGILGVVLAAGGAIGGAVLASGATQNQPGSAPLAGLSIAGGVGGGLLGAFAFGSSGAYRQRAEDILYSKSDEGCNDGPAIAADEWQPPKPSAATATSSSTRAPLRRPVVTGCTDEDKAQMRASGMSESAMATACN